MLLNIEIPLMAHLPVDYNDPLGVDATAVANTVVGIITIPFKCEVVRSQVTVTETFTGVGVIDFDKRVTAGSATDDVDAALGSLAMTTSAAGTVKYDLVGAGTVLYPGQEVAVVMTTAATDGSFIPCLIVKPVPEELVNIPAMVETA